MSFQGQIKASARCKILPSLYCRCSTTFLQLKPKLQKFYHDFEITTILGEAGILYMKNGRFLYLSLKFEILDFCTFAFPSHLHPNNVEF